MKFEIKHLPQKLDDVVFADAVVALTLKEYANNMRDKSLLLYGPKGSGKSVELCPKVADGLIRRRFEVA